MAGEILLPGKGPGQWQRVLLNEFEPNNRRWGALIRCAGECGRILAVVDHTISPDGQVTPSVGHPPEYPPCSWHPTPKLAGWAPAPPMPPLPPKVTCERCGKTGYQLGGWGTWSGGPGVICAACITERLQQAATPKREGESG